MTSLFLYVIVIYFAGSARDGWRDHVDGAVDSECAAHRHYHMVVALVPRVGTSLEIHVALVSTILYD